MAEDRLEGEDAELWTRFHETVNMSGAELRSWLLTDASGPEVFTSDPAMGITATGRDVLHVLDKRRTDLTDDDVRTMRHVVDEVAALLSHPRPDDEKWRHALMGLGHDPLKPDSPRPGDEPDVGEPE